jgi:Flp pilus assembly protein TadG
MTRRGQALVELAVSLPVLLLLALGATQFVRLALTRAGLDAATAAAVAVAARAPSAATAGLDGKAAFDGVSAGYGLGRSATVTVAAGDFPRGGHVSASAHADVSLGFSGIPALDLSWRLSSSASARVEDWRSRPTGP